MIWSLVKILGFVAFTACLAWIGGWLIESDGHLRIVAMGFEMTIGPLAAAILAILLVIAVWVVMRISGLLIATFRFINGDETAISRYFDRNNERRGFEALADGMMALASGEGRLAMAKAARAEKYLARPELTNLLAAQAAELAGDRAKAEEVYKRLLQDDRTRFVGVRGIMKQKLSEGDTETALQLAERAFALKPAHQETTDILLKLQADKGDWGGARRTLGAKLRAGTLPRDVHRRRDAVLALSDARAGNEPEGDEARTAVYEANRLSPDLVPAAAAAARAFAGEGRNRQAIRAIRKAWEVEPHPELAAAFAAIEPDESAIDRLKRFQTLLRIHPDHDESRQIHAELALAADEFEIARDALGDLADRNPTSRTLALLAAVRRGTGADDNEVRAILTRAANAPRGATWVCDNCHTIAGSWAPVCANCSSLDTLSWRQPVSMEVEVAEPLIEPRVPTPEPIDAQARIEELQAETAPVSEAESDEEKQPEPQP